MNGGGRAAVRHPSLQGADESDVTLRRARALSGVVLLAFAVTAVAWGIEMERRSVAFALLVNLTYLGVAYLLWILVPLRFPDGYYHVLPLERSGRLHDALGIRGFQRVLRRFRFYVLPGHGSREPEASVKLAAATIGPETVHALVFVVVTVLAADMALRRGWWDTAAWLLAFNVLLNAYPVLSLRAVRARMERLFG
jgi:glycosyl-4,4'-diaponeurosporenoate acyltransferase